MRTSHNQGTPTKLPEKSGESEICFTTLLPIDLSTVCKTDPLSSLLTTGRHLDYIQKKFIKLINLLQY